MKTYLEKAVLKSPYRNLMPGEFEFRPGLNVIVGENGSGKSSLLKLISQQTDEDIELILTDETIKNGVETRFFDFEMDNPRTKDPRLQANYRYALTARFLSHGEAILPYVETLSTMKKTVIFVDEPDAGVSLKNQAKIVNHLKKAELNDCQVFVATHSYVLISNVDQVFSMDELKWISSSDFLQKALNLRQ